MVGSERTLSYGDPRDSEEDTFVAPYLVLALECERPLAPPVRLSIAEVDEVLLGRGAARAHRRVSEDGRAILRVEAVDRWMSSRHARLRRTAGGWAAADDGSKNGTFVNGQAIAERELRDGDLIEAGSTLFLFRERVRRSAREAPDVELTDAQLLPTLCPPLAREFEALVRFAASAVPLVLFGETGTGKEVAARAVHALSGRPGAFVAVNCGALPESLIESELFGYRRGAFSGASEDRPGLVRAADGGTLFLDEVAELAPAAQVKLLRVLQEREVTPVGDVRPVRVDARVVAATHRDLAEMIDSGGFRADLYARLAGFSITLPPLRERREDIGLITGLLLARLAGEGAGEISFERAAARALFDHDWPRNIRELEQALRAAITLAGGARIELGHLPESLRGGGEPGHEVRVELLRLLREHRGNVSAVARAMGKARVQIRRWCKRYDIDPASFREAE